MKLRFVAAFLIFANIFTLSPSAHAANCGNVKKQILAFESIVKSNLKNLYKYDEIYNRVPSSQATKILSIQKLIEKNLHNVWKLGTNNPQCLSKTQKITLEQPWMYADSIIYVEFSRFYGNTPSLTVRINDPFVSFFKF
jgi:hypothetical protein